MLHAENFKKMGQRRVLSGAIYKQPINETIVKKCALLMKCMPVNRSLSQTIRANHTILSH